jgi:hypothetical protein
MNTSLTPIDARFPKRLYLSIIADYDANKAIWPEQKARIGITLYTNQQRIHVAKSRGSQLRLILLVQEAVLPFLSPNSVSAALHF